MSSKRRGPKPSVPNDIRLSVLNRLDIFTENGALKSLSDGVWDDAVADIKKEGATGKLVQYDENIINVPNEQQDDNLAKVFKNLLTYFPFWANLIPTANEMNISGVAPKLYYEELIVGMEKKSSTNAKACMKIDEFILMHSQLITESLHTVRKTDFQNYEQVFDEGDSLDHSYLKEYDNWRGLGDKNLLEGDLFKKTNSSSSEDSDSDSEVNDDNKKQSNMIKKDSKENIDPELRYLQYEEQKKKINKNKYLSEFNGIEAYYKASKLCTS
ncbi:hypothetical protein TKK_0005941 [Trichogramma kaykai]